MIKLLHQEIDKTAQAVLDDIKLATVLLELINTSDKNSDIVINKIEVLLKDARIELERLTIKQEEK